jgi:hypothetical protein
MATDLGKTRPHRMSAHYFGQELKTTKRYQLGP